jgi:hypothetical protein
MLERALGSSRAANAGVRVLRSRTAALGCAACLVLLTPSCAGVPEGSGESARYPEKKRPEPVRSASDGEVLGADEQAPEDTLAGSASTDHPAPGWIIEEGRLVPASESRAQQDVRTEERGSGVKQADPLDCIPPGSPEARNAAASEENAAVSPSATATPPRKKLCPPGAPK